jgi:hypothetical protein
MLLELFTLRIDHFEPPASRAVVVMAAGSWESLLAPPSKATGSFMLRSSREQARQALQLRFLAYYPNT